MSIADLSISLGSWAGLEQRDWDARQHYLWKFWKLEDDIGRLGQILKDGSNAWAH